MTPFGLRLRQLRRQKGVTLQEQADVLGVSAAYISSLEHGKRGKPSPAFVDQICVWFGLIWDDAEQLKYLAQMSHPKPTLKTGGLSAEATFLSNLLAQNIDRLSDKQCAVLNDVLSRQLGTNRLSFYIPSGSGEPSSRQA